jgi:hypothetical protein
MQTNAQKTNLAQTKDEELLHLRELVCALQKTNKDQSETIAQLKAQIAWLKRHIFGRKSEKIDVAQLLLQLEESVVNTERQLEESKIQEIKYTRTIAQREKATLPAPTFDHLPIRETLVLLPEEVKKNPNDYVQISEEKTFELDVDPPSFYRREIKRPKFCAKDDKSLPPLLAPAPNRVIPGSYASPGVLAHIITEKYLDHLPLYRLEKRFERQGVKISRQTMCDWLAACADRLEPIYKLMRAQVRESGYVQMDETPVTYLDPDASEKGSRKGYFWVLSNPGGNVIFDWNPNRKKENVEDLLGKDFKGVLHTDGYVVYGSYDAAHANAKWICCWVHARRYFFNALKESPKEAARALELIGKLYAHEREWNAAAEQRASAHPPPVDAQARAALLAQEHSRRRRERMKNFPKILKALRNESRAWQVDVLQKSQLGRAVKYLLAHWRPLCRVMWYGCSRLDTNGVESAIRPSAIGKKNWLFIGRDCAGWRSAVFYSLVLTCQRFGKNPIAYLRDVLRRLPDMTNQDDLSVLLPENWVAPSP